MPRYELKKNCMFVDAYDLDKASANPHGPRDRYPKDINYAHVIDKTHGPTKLCSSSHPKVCPYTMLNDMAAFIGRFIVMGVETDFILPQIVSSEYGITPDEAKEEIGIVLRLMEEYTQPRKQVQTFVPAASPGTGKHEGCYELNFKVNPMGIGIFKG